MVYRTAPSAEPREIVGDVLLSVDASGAAGAAAAHGAHGSDGSGSGGDGRRGGDAGAAGRGWNGGNVAVSLEPDGSGGVRVRGATARADGSRTQVDERIALGDHGFVDVTARGGNGGAGGHGGRGGDGARGSRGRDASRYSSGTNGGRGGDGGDGGAGSSGGDAGAGGNVVVHVDDADTHLLMLVRSGVEGGRGGAAGAHGAGGAGGPGGDGGSSHSWTETEHYTDHQGNRQTRTTFHSNSGGHDGPSGSSGRSGSGPLHPGRDGADGSFAIEVRGEGGAARYAVRYHLELAGIALETDDRDGVFEPGETVRVRALRVRNVGGMPSPRTRAITLEVRDGRWAREIPGQSIEVPRSLPAGMQIEVPAELSLEIRDHAPTDPADPLLDRERISLRAHVVDVARSFEGFEQADTAEAATMTVRFPTACSVLQGLVSLAPGEVTRLRYVIRNQSRSALGSRSPGKRRLRARIRLQDSELDDRHAVLFDERGAAIAMGGDGLVREIELLEAGDDWIFEGAVGLREDAPAYRELRLRLTLEIGRLDDPYTLRAVQHRELRVRCAKRLAPGTRADWLLVTHHRTSREELDAWEALARREERSLAVWDLSLHGQLALEAGRDDGPSMLERLGGGLVIVPGHPLQTVAGEARPHTFLSPTTLARAAACGVDVLLAGAEPALGALLMPEHAESEVAAADGERALVERIAARRDETDAFVEEAELHEVGFFFEDARAERLARRAHGLAERLARRFPLRRFVVVWDHAPERRAHWGLVMRTRLGTIRVLARPAARSGLAHVAVADDRVRDPAFVLGHACAAAISMASGPDDQLEGLARALAGGDVARARRWADAIVCGLAAEQAAVMRRTRARAGLSLEGMREALPRLARLAHSPLLGDRDPRSHEAGVLVSLAARVLAFADAQPFWWERVPGVAWSRRAAGLDALTEELIAAFLEVQSSDPEARRVLRERLRVETAALRDAWKRARREDRRDRAAWARELAMGAIEDEGVTTDDELVVADAGTVLKRSEWSGHVARARAHGESIAELVAATGDERRKLLVARSCEQLLAGGEEREPDESAESGETGERGSGEEDRAALRAAGSAR